MDQLHIEHYDFSAADHSITYLNSDLPKDLKYKFTFYENHDAVPLKPHRQPTYEILYVQSGSAQVTIDSIEYTVKEHEVVMIPPGTDHGIVSRENISYLILIFYRSFTEKYNELLEQVIFPHLIHSKTLIELFEKMNTIRLRPMPRMLKQMTLEGYVYLLLSHMIEHHSSYIPGGQTEDVPKTDALIDTINYISKNYKRPVTVEQIVQRTNYSHSYLCRIFKKATGKTISFFLNEMRCKQAKLLLNNSCMTISEIALACGFESSSYFTQTYKKIIGELPSQTRIKAQ